MGWKEPGLFNDWDEAVLREGRYGKDTATMDKDGGVELCSESKWDEGDRFFFLDAETLERLVRLSRAMRSYY